MRSQRSPPRAKKTDLSKSRWPAFAGGPSRQYSRLAFPLDIQAAIYLYFRGGVPQKIALASKKKAALPRRHHSSVVGSAYAPAVMSILTPGPMVEETATFWM